VNLGATLGRPKKPHILEILNVHTHIEIHLQIGSFGQAFEYKTQMHNLSKAEEAVGVADGGGVQLHDKGKAATDKEGVKVGDWGVDANNVAFDM